MFVICMIFCCGCDCCVCCGVVLFVLVGVDGGLMKYCVVWCCVCGFMLFEMLVVFVIVGLLVLFVLLLLMCNLCIDLCEEV